MTLAKMRDGRSYSPHAKSRFDSELFLNITTSPHKRTTTWFETSLDPVPAARADIGS
jgi:hypothetical protein